MAAQKGRDFVIYVGDGATPEVFTKLGALRATTMTLNGEMVDITDKNSAGWRELLADGGVKSMTLAGNGVFKDAAIEETLRAQAFAQSIDNYRVQSGNGNKFTGAFQITVYERSGDHNADEQFSITIESAGAITFAAS